MTFDQRILVHCACGLYVYDRADLKPTGGSKPDVNARCVHRDDLRHFRIEMEDKS